MGAPTVDLSAVALDATGFGPAFCRNILHAPYMLMQVGRCGYMYGKGSTASDDVVVASKEIPGGTIKPGSLIKFMHLIGKYSPQNGGCTIRIKVRQGANVVTVAQTDTASTAATQSLDFELYLSTDGKWGYAKGSSNINFFNDASNDVGVVYSLSGTIINPNGLPNPRLQSNIAFVQIGAPPSPETILIDWSQDVTLEVVHRAPTTERIELQGFTAMLYAPPDGEFLANPKLTLCFGDSLTEGSGSTGTGSGSTTPNDWVSQLGRIRTGTSFINLGLGGQKITPIVDRLVADTNAKYGRVILWAGVNDITDDADVVNTIRTQIQRVVDYRKTAANPTGLGNLLICTLTPNTTWTQGETYYTRLQAVNTMIATDYPNNHCDLFAAITAGSSNPGYPDASDLADTIHHDNSGYAKDAAAIDASMTSGGWA